LLPVAYPVVWLCSIKEQEILQKAGAYTNHFFCNYTVGHHQSCLLRQGKFYVIWKPAFYESFIFGHTIIWWVFIKITGTLSTGFYTGL